jgi:dihydroorotate dehydrogenase electron transfer subunit
LNDKGELALYYNVWDNGKGTGWLSQCQKGDSISIFGPLGNGFSVNPEAKNLLLVAGGIGIAPLIFLAEDALKDGKQVTLITGTPTSHRYPKGFLSKEMKLVTVTEDGSVGIKGLATDLIAGHIGRADQVFACGPTPMYRAMAALQELKGRPVQVSLEAVMGCGVGVCYGCTVKTKGGLKQACTDGPVFDLGDILWDWLD